jgi:hypothetical protein
VIALVLMAAVSRYALWTLCPSDADLARAVYDRAGDDAAAYMAARANDPNDAVFAHAVPVRRISDVHCGNAEPGPVATVKCSFTARVGSHTVFEVALLERRGGGWAIVKELSVSR